MSMQSIELAYQTTGRVVIDQPLAEAPGILVVLHGYAQTADDSAAMLRPVAVASGWALVCPEAPHVFYQRQHVGASWMTSHRRDHLIASNARWLQACLAQVRTQTAAAVVVCGFSQGASQAWRIGMVDDRLAGLVAIGGDIPPELTVAPASPPPTLLVRGEDDRRYSATHLRDDTTRLTAMGWPHTAVTTPGAHAVGAETCAALVTWLATHVPQV